MSGWKTRERPWTPHDIERLRKMVAGGKMSQNQIAEELGRSRNSVAGQVSRLGLRITANPAPKMRNRVTPRPTDPFANILFNCEPLIFADTGPSCARCGVREDAHHQHGCGQFAAELRVRT